MFQISDGERRSTTFTDDALALLSGILGRERQMSTAVCITPNYAGAPDKDEARDAQPG